MATQPTKSLHRGTLDAILDAKGLDNNGLVVALNGAEARAWRTSDREQRAYLRAYADEVIRIYRERKGLVEEPRRRRVPYGAALWVV